jgi:dihydroorotate dehydrogenase
MRSPAQVAVEDSHGSVYLRGGVPVVGARLLLAHSMAILWRSIRALLFRLDPERAHHLSMGLFAAVCALPGAAPLLRRLLQVRDPRLAVRCFGLDFETPVGLAAGFDKEARWHLCLGALGFGCIEIGTVTANAQPGNPKPRLFRLAPDRALLNRFGFNNDGAAAAAGRLARRGAGYRLGAKIGRNKEVDNEAANENYLAALREVWAGADYIAVNVSSPNTPGLRGLQNAAALGELLAAVCSENRRLAAASGGAERPVLVKIAPDLDDEQLDAIADLVLQHPVAGIIATNTTLRREGLATPAAEVEALGAGGLSGAPLTACSRRVVARLYLRLQGRLPIIGVGGISNAAEAFEMIRAGASLVQVYSGFIYEGPLMPRNIALGLLQRAGSRSISAIVGEAASLYGRPSLSLEEA